MLRIAVIDLLLFALPFLLYAAYVIWVKGASPQTVWQGAPFLWLFAAAVGLMIVAISPTESGQSPSRRPDTLIS